VCCHLGRGINRDPSKLDRQPFPDFVHPLFKRVESGVKVPVVKVEYVPQRDKSENPVVIFHVEQHLFKAMSHGDNRIQQKIHRVTCSNKNPIRKERPGLCISRFECPKSFTSVLDAGKSAGMHPASHG
jgi:hypothetical protein